MAVGPRPPEVEKQNKLKVKMNMSCFLDPHSFVFVASSFMYCTLIMHLAPQVEAVQIFCMGFQLVAIRIAQATFLLIHSGTQ